jgi:HAD superfamily hydrolase (TIGR01509 family)
MTDQNTAIEGCEGPPARAILFDVDGTLVDTNDLHTAAWRETFRAFGHDLDFDVIRAQIGKGGDNLIPTLLSHIDEAGREAMEAHRGELFKRDYLPRATPFDGVRELFLRLRQDGIRIVLASSAHQAEIEYYLGILAAEDLVEAVTTKDDVEHSKPDPDIFAAALAKVAPHGAEEVFVIGDSPWDVKAARKLSLRTIGFRSGGFPDGDLTGAGACALYDGPADLRARFNSSPLARR